MFFCPIVTIRNHRFSLFHNTKCTICFRSINVCSYKAYSTVDGKEVLYHVVHVDEWKKEVVECFMNALHIVHSYNSKQFIVLCVISRIGYS